MKKIIVALDNSPVAASVLHAATELAAQQSAELVLLQAVTLPVDIPIDIYYRPKDELPVVLQKESKHELETMRNQVPSSIKTRIRVEVGVPWQVICDTAKEEEADLVVMGAHGYRFYERMLGTTSGRVVTHAECSVLVVRTKDSQKK